MPSSAASSAWARPAPARAPSTLSAPPAALIYHAVLCCIFAVSLSIIHETQIPFTFFRDFLKKVFEQEQSRAKKNITLLLDNPKKDEPLGDERKDYKSEIKLLYITIDLRKCLKTNRVFNHFSLNCRIRDVEDKFT